MLNITVVDIFLVAVALILAIFYFRRKNDPRFPPGPLALPIIGNLLQFGSKPIDTLWRWAEEYGQTFGLRIGCDDVIILNDAQMIKAVFQEENASGRPSNPVFLAIGNGNYGIAMSEGQNWEEQRGFILRKLREFGFSKSAMEILILEEVDSMVKWFEKRLDTPIFGTRIFNGAVINSLWNIIARERSEWDAPKPPEMIKRSEAVIKSFNRVSASGLAVAPFLRFIAPEATGWNEWTRSLNLIAETANVSVQRHARELDPNNPQDLIDHYLIEKRNETDPNSSFYKGTGDKNLRAAIPDLFIAGSETTSSTLSWALLLLSNNQDVQKKLQQELDSILGESRTPVLSDRPNLPYTDAVVLETLRRTSVINLGLPHKMHEDAVINGYFFPKNATVLANIFRVNNDPKIWGDPKNFRPERFLSSDGSKIIKHSSSIFLYEI